MPNLVQTTFDFNVILQSFMSIAFTLFGMLFTSSLFKKAVEHKSMRLFPFVLLSSTILGFKSNIELGYVMHLSTLCTPMFLTDFKKTAVANSSLIMIESFSVGIFSGILGIFEVAFEGDLNWNMGSIIFVSSVLTCFVSTAIFVFFFLFCLEISAYLSIDLELFLMPLLNVINDIFVVKILFVSGKNLNRLTIHQHFCIILLISLAVGSLFYFIFLSENLLPMQSIDTLALTFSLNIISGFILERLSLALPATAPAFPVFTGMSSSIALIYLHKLFSSVENQQMPIPSAVYNSLAFISFLVSIAYIHIARATHIVYSIRFSFCFIIAFTIHMLLLLKIVEYLIKFLRKQGKNTSSNIVPLVTSISDFTGSLALALITGFLLNKKF